MGIWVDSMSLKKYIFKTNLFHKFVIKIFEVKTWPKRLWGYVCFLGVSVCENIIFFFFFFYYYDIMSSAKNISDPAGSDT